MTTLLFPMQSREQVLRILSDQRTDWGLWVDEGFGMSSTTETAKQYIDRAVAAGMITKEEGFAAAFPNG